MDWISENKLKNGLIAALLALNLVTLSIIWIRTAPGSTAPAGEQERRPPESTGLMKTTLGLSDDQAGQFSTMVTDFHAQTKPLNDRLTVLKKHLADELFTSPPDSAAAQATAKQIGETQAEVEMQRFRHFQDFLAICTPDQREKLRPILLDLFGRRPPREEPRIGKGRQGEQPGGQRSAGERREGQPAAPGSGVPDGGAPNRDKAEPSGAGPAGPPSVEEKLARYSARLGLSAGQEQQVRTILQETRQKGEELRQRRNPERTVIDAEKERIRNDEDQRIRALLNPQQRLTFDTMIANRGDSRR